MSAADWTLRRCWLGCRRTGVSVIWVGPVMLPDGVHVPAFGCRACPAHVTAVAWQTIRERDLPRIGHAP